MEEVLAPEARRCDARAFGVIVLLSVLTAVVYSDVSSHDFVEFDDNHYVLTNPGLDGRVGFDDLQLAFFESYASNWAPSLRFP